MTLSVWRYSHLALALVSGAFLLVASLTGIILAFEPMVQLSRPYKVADLDQISLAETMAPLQEEYDEVLELTVDNNDFVLASVITKEGIGESLYINPRTGKKIGEPYEKNAIFKFATNLHRSLFLKGLGRFFIGLISLLLFLIALTGSFLIIKRQGGLKRFFSKINREYFDQYYHIITGRLLLLPILIIALTGVYLSAEKFNLLPNTFVVHDIQNSTIKTDVKKPSTTFPIFKNTPLSQVKTVIFPFSDDLEDYFQIGLTNREILVNQHTGTIISEAYYPFTAIASNLSLKLHTGQGSLLWSLILLISSCSILFFMYSGFKMTLRRRKNTKALSTKTNKDTSEYILLVGSETGSTFRFAQQFFNALVTAGKSVFLTELNQYSSYARAKHLIIFTATYGAGEAPANANKFMSRITKLTTHHNQINFSVVGFGSLVYPDYCAFAIAVDILLEKHPYFVRTMELYKINNQSFEAFEDWACQWSKHAKTPVRIKKDNPSIVHNTVPFSVVHKTAPNEDHTFLLRLHPLDEAKFKSGDLLEVIPSQGSAARLYSIAKIEDDILLSVKKHEFGQCSQYLSELSQNKTLTAGIQSNPSFHFPNDAPAVIFICNGTGMAPFLGMLQENKNKTPIHLFWGGRNKVSYTLYENYITTALDKGRLATVHIAYSQQNKEKTYVQELIAKERHFVAEQLNQGAVIMLCGSIALQKEIVALLEEIVKKKLKRPLSQFQNNAQLKMDCY